MQPLQRLFNKPAIFRNLIAIFVKNLPYIKEATVRSATATTTERSEIRNLTKKNDKENVKTRKENHPASRRS